MVDFVYINEHAAPHIKLISGCLVALVANESLLFLYVDFSELSFQIGDTVDTSKIRVAKMMSSRYADSSLVEYVILPGLKDLSLFTLT